MADMKVTPLRTFVARLNDSLGTYGLKVKDAKYTEKEGQPDQAMLRIQDDCGEDFETPSGHGGVSLVDLGDYELTHATHKHGVPLVLINGYVMEAAPSAIAGFIFGYSP